MTILYQTRVIQERSELIAGISAILIFIFIGMTLSMMLMEKWGLTIVSSVAVLLCIAGIGYGATKVPINKYRYEVLLDDSYSVEELSKKYDMVEQRGKIYVLEDKNVRE